MYKDLITELEDRQKITLLSTEIMIKGMKENIIWLDLKRIIESWLIDTYSLLENSELEDLKSIYMLKGRAKAIRDFLNLPDVMKTIKKLDISNEKGIKNES